MATTVLTFTTASGAVLATATATSPSAVHAAEHRLKCYLAQKHGATVTKIEQMLSENRLQLHQNTPIFKL